MKHILISNSIIFFIILVGSCTKKNSGWDDVIKLSTKSANFSSNADSITITAEGNWWWINNVFADSNSYYYDQDVHPESENYSIQNDYFEVAKKDNHTIFVKMDANPLSSQRRLMISVEAGDYFDMISITQAGKE